MCYGSWNSHVVGWWKHKDDPNVLFLKYEDLKQVIIVAKRRVKKHLLLFTAVGYNWQNRCRDEFSKRFTGKVYLYENYPFINVQSWTKFLGQEILHMTCGSLNTRETKSCARFKLPVPRLPSPDPSPPTMLLYSIRISQLPHDFRKCQLNCFYSIPDIPW